MKVLVIQPKIGMGDMIIYLPYIQAIYKKFDLPVSILVKKNSRADQILGEDESVNEIIFLKRNQGNNGEHDGIVGFFRLVKELKSKKFDKVFIYSSSLRYYLISKLAGINNISQYPLFRKKDNIVTSAKIFTENEINKIVSPQPIIKIGKSKLKNFDTNYKHICLGFSASGPTKRWDLKNYIKLCEKLNNNFKCKFYLAGGKNDAEMLEDIINSNIGSNCVSFENLTIEETMPIIKNCDLYIGNDTGWLHISSGLGLKCLALFMDSPVMAYGKYSKNISVVIPDGETEESTTHDTLGKDKISFEKVYIKALELLS